MNEPRQNCFVFNTLIAFLAFLPCSDLKAQDEVDQRAPSPVIASSASAATKPTPKPLFQENFNDGSADGMAALSGTWSVVDGQLNVVPGSPSLVDKVLRNLRFPGQYRRVGKNHPRQRVHVHRDLAAIHGFTALL
jgi:hypothetical protein